MRVLKLTDSVATKLLARRRSGDAEADRVASRIIGDVRKRGDAALFAWTRKLDGLELTASRAKRGAAKALWISEEDIASGAREASPALRNALAHAARNIRRVAQQQKPRDWSIAVEPGVRVSQRVIPLETIACYIPGGRFSLISTLLMTVIPAQVAGVKRIIVACPKPNAGLLAAAQLLGVKEVARIGGAQAIAAFAYGTRAVPRVDKIFGPGNRYVTAAKRLVSSDCAIDLPAGPTEVLILAQSGNPEFIAADLIAQAEHDPDAVAFFVTTSAKFAGDVRASVARQLESLPQDNLARRSLAENGSILIARDAKEAARFANLVAPEHLSLPDSNGSSSDHKLSAGSVFLGPWAAQSVGDYASGTNHVLPTSGGARARGGLSTWDFVRCTSVQELTRKGLQSLAPVVAALADAEGLLAHRRAVEVRTQVPK
jgi:histidinol dehydrogenase